MAKQKTPVVTIGKDQVIDGHEYQPRDGEKGVRYQVADGVQVYIKDITPELVEIYSEKGKKKGDEEDTRTPHAIAFERVKAITEGAPAAFNWKGCSMAVVWRIITDFLSLSSPILNEPTEFSDEFLQ